MSIEVSQVLLSPIKGFSQVQATSPCSIGQFGNIGSDRRYWFQFQDSEEILNAKWANRKKFRRFYRIRTKYDDSLSSVTLSLSPAEDDSFSIEPQQFRLDSGRGITEWMSRVVGQDLEFHCNMETGRPDDMVLKSFTALSLGSAEEIAREYSWQVAEVIARLRPTILLSGLAPFEEFSLLGQEFSIGNSRFLAAEACLRCSVPATNPYTGEPTKGFQKSFGAYMRAKLTSMATQEHWREKHGYYAAINTKAINVDRDAKIQSGDTVTVH